MSKEELKDVKKKTIVKMNQQSKSVKKKKIRKKMKT